MNRVMILDLIDIKKKLLTNKNLTIEFEKTILNTHVPTLLCLQDPVKNDTMIFI